MSLLWAGSRLAYTFDTPNRIPRLFTCDFAGDSRKQGGFKVDQGSRRPIPPCWSPDQQRSIVDTAEYILTLS